MKGRKKKKDQKATKQRPKQAHPGIKCIRGEPLYYSELKKRISLTLTPTAIEQLSRLADATELSRSELLERYLRGLLCFLPCDQAEEE
jgi:hypothetical protein